MTLTKTKKLSSETGTAHNTATFEYDLTLFEKLRALRKRLADVRNVPPYMIFGDVTLQQMASYLLHSPESLSRISGVGTLKLEQYSEEFLVVIRAYALENGLTERDIPLRRMKRNCSVRRAGSTYDETKKLLIGKLTISEIAGRRGLTEDRIINHLERMVTAREELDLEYLMPSVKRFAKIETAFQQSGSLILLSPVRDLLGEGYSSKELRLVRIRLRQQRGENRKT